MFFGSGSVSGNGCQDLSKIARAGRLKGGAVTYTKCDISLHIKRKYLHVLGPRHSDKTAYLLQTQPLWILLILED
jgi:hypothetical protein